MEGRPAGGDYDGDLAQVVWSPALTSLVKAIEAAVPRWNLPAKLEHLIREHRCIKPYSLSNNETASDLEYSWNASTDGAGNVECASLSAEVLETNACSCKEMGPKRSTALDGDPERRLVQYLSLASTLPNGNLRGRTTALAERAVEAVLNGQGLSVKRVRLTGKESLHDKGVERALELGHGATIPLIWAVHRESVRVLGAH